MKSETCHPDDPSRRPDCTFLQAWIPKELALLVDSALDHKNLDRSEFLRQALEEKLAKAKQTSRVEITVPFLTVAGVRAVLGSDEDDILKLISARHLRWAFDLRGLGAVRASVRIFAPCVHEYQARQQGHPLPPCATSLEQVFDSIFPHKRPTLRATELKARWNASSTHLHNLIAAGLLTAVSGTGNSVNQTPMVTRASAIEFLKQRQL